MESHPELRRELGLRDLILFNIAAVIGVRWLAAAAHTGPVSISLWVLAAVMFFVPSALAVARLSAAYPDEGGIYVWTKKMFGDWHGFLCGWCYWLSNMFYFPSLLVAGLGMAEFVLGWREDKLYVLLASVAILWLALLANLFGLSVAKWTSNAGALATYTFGGLLIVFGMLVWMRGGSATRLDVFPKLDLDNVNFWSQIAFAFGGLELSAVLGGEIRHPARDVPRAAWISGALITGFYIAGTLALMVLLPPGRISILTGLVQGSAEMGARLHAPWLGAVMMLLILAGVGGQLCAWIGAPARIPFVIGLDRYFPPAFARLHPRWGTPHIAILSQGVVGTLFVIALQIGENLRIAYQLLVDMSVIIYFIPFLYLFAAAWRIRRPVAAASGIFVTIISIAVSLIPPAGVNSVALFECKLIGGSLVLILVARAFFIYARRYHYSSV